ncbi:hypothetical protein G6O69_33905 [Pseudenhygromyxa sp. WMMC2535]|uniref:hypothetical protein n=1 Tax=Pseudenhygromyxa sp. WMMC2535 TaxID=2712867 RepID=UPI00155497C2|nr:hypothetical protein [Pseudenhygromyxa sp. WMMC2535]NVB42865.1 hypothetical protein [Pseudenhygromyxa sp. WMMC2535]
MAGPSPALHLRQCTGCGATVELTGVGLSATCGYCGAPMVDESRATAAIDAIVPFRVPKPGALDRLRTYLAGHRWAPRELHDLRVDGRGLRGMLVPFWVYEGVVRSQYQARVGVDWYRTVTTHINGKTQTQRKRETEWFTLTGSAARQIEDHLVSASVGLSEPESNALEPFDLGWARDFDPRMLSGLEAELPSVATVNADQTATVELRDAERQRLPAQLLPGDHNRVEQIASQIEIRARRLVLLPVWIASYEHRDVQLRLLVNGQTGEVVGVVPKSKLKIALAVLAGVVVVGLVVLAVILATKGLPG